LSLDTQEVSQEDWPILVAERDQLRLENEHLAKVVMTLQEENRHLQSTVKYSKKKLALTDETFGIANLCK